MSLIFFKMVLQIGQNYIDDAGSLALLQAVSANERSGLQVLDMRVITHYCFNDCN